MQSSAKLLRTARPACRAMLAHAEPVASASRLPWTSQRHISFWRPLDWLQSRVPQPQVRKTASEDDVEYARRKRAETGKQNVFDEMADEEEGQATDRSVPSTSAVAKQAGKKGSEHKYSTANFKISHRKLNDLGRQISGKPIDYAILQMKFSEKRASARIKSMLVVAKNHATEYKKLDERKLIVSEAWVSKGPKVIKRIEIKGRGRHGVRKHPDSRLNVVLREGKTWAEKAEEQRARQLRRIRSAGITREDKPLRNPAQMWAW